MDFGVDNLADFYHRRRNGRQSSKNCFSTTKTATGKFVFNKMRSSTLQKLVKFF